MTDREVRLVRRYETELGIRMTPIRLYEGRAFAIGDDRQLSTAPIPGPRSDTLDTVQMPEWANKDSDLPQDLRASAICHFAYA